jgi:hypothetical protein
MNMADKCSVGKSYKVFHGKKGTFRITVTEINGEWITGILIDGCDKATMRNNIWQLGEQIIIKNSAAWFYAEDEDDETKVEIKTEPKLIKGI